MNNPYGNISSDLTEQKPGPFDCISEDIKIELESTVFASEIKYDPLDCISRSKATVPKSEPTDHLQVMNHSFSNISSDMIEGKPDMFDCVSEDIKMEPKSVSPKSISCAAEIKYEPIDLTSGPMLSPTPLEPTLLNAESMTGM